MRPSPTTLSQWMWQKTLENYPTSSLGVSPIKKENLAQVGATVLADEAEKPLVFDIFLGETKYFFNLAWLKVGNHQWLFLIFDIDENSTQLRSLNPTNLKDALVIAMASYRALKKLNIEPQSYLMSGVRSIGIQLERVRDYMERFNLDFFAAKSLCSHDSAMIFESKSPSEDEIDFLSLALLLKNYASGFGVNWARFLSLGSIGESLEERKFSLTKLATHFVTIWPTLSKSHEILSKLQLSKLYEGLSPLDIPLQYLGPAIFDGQSFKTKEEICVVFDMRGNNFELLSPIFENPQWHERFSHRLIPFKTVFLKEAHLSSDLFQTIEGRPFSPDQIILNIEDIKDLADFAQKCSLYVRAEVFSNLDDDLFSLYLMNHGAFLFMDQEGWWQRGFRFEFGRRWESEFKRDEYFITQFFDVLIQLFENPQAYQQRLSELHSYLEESYTTTSLAQRLRESYIDKLSSFHDHLHCFELSNFHKLEKSSSELARYWSAMSAIHLDIEGDYLMLEAQELGPAFKGQRANFIEARELSIDLKLYAPKIDSKSLNCEVVIFDEDATIKRSLALELIEVIGKGTAQTLHFELAPTTFDERERMAIRLTPKLNHFEFPFELMISAWV